MTTLAERSGDRTACGGLSAYKVDLIAVNTCPGSKSIL